MANVVISFGFRVGLGGAILRPLRQSAFIQDVRICVYESGGVIDASIIGDSDSDEWGKEPAAWIAASVPDNALDELRRDLADVARDYEQDAIALTVGAVEFVASTPASNGVIPFTLPTDISCSHCGKANGH